MQPALHSSSHLPILAQCFSIPAGSQYAERPILAHLGRCEPSNHPDYAMTAGLAGCDSAGKA